MPTRYKLGAYKPATEWPSLWNDMYAKLKCDAVLILRPTGFYDTHDIEVPQTSEGCRTAEENAAIGRIATALTIAASSAHQAPAGIISAWLERIERDPKQIRSQQLPPEVHWMIASNYRRELEEPGTHLQDVFEKRRVRFENQARRPTPRNISRAAHLARNALHRRRGRPRNLANRILAEYLSGIFRSFGGQIVRRQLPVDVAGGGVRYMEDGPFYHFLVSVIGPLQRHLNRHRLPSVTIETIERIATEEFALNT